MTKSQTKEKTLLSTLRHIYLPPWSVEAAVAALCSDASYRYKYLLHQCPLTASPTKVTAAIKSF